jgi:hypothetical protein
VPLTVSATVALVMVLPGRWSQGRKPSAAPRWFSGKIRDLRLTSPGNRPRRLHDIPAQTARDRQK